MGDLSTTTIVGILTTSAKEFDNTIKSMQMVYYSTDADVCNCISLTPA